MPIHAGWGTGMSIFRRRRKRPILQSLRHFFWPKTGWGRAVRYVGYRLRRLKGSPNSIAIGFAWGVAVSFTPFIGAHFVLAALATWVMGGNLLASAVGTVVGNPWTFPVIWLLSFKLGSYLFGLNPLVEIPEDLTMVYIFDSPSMVLLPMAVGGVLLGAVAWVGTFWTVRRMVDRYRRMRQARIERRSAMRLKVPS